MTIRTQLGPLKIRQAVASDTEGLYSVLRNVAEWLDRQNSSQWIPSAHDDDIDLVAQMIMSGTCYVVEHDNKIMATVRIGWGLPDYWQPKIQNIGYISTLYVHRELAGHKIGESILQWAEHMTSLQKKAVVCLDCYVQNTVLCRYYETHGYKSVGEVETYPGYSQRLYKKPLLEAEA